VTFFEYTFTPSEPTKEPFVCEMALLRARRSGATASLRACANTAEPTKAHSQEVKDHSAAPHPHGDPANGEPTGAIRAHRRHRTRGTRAGQGAQARPPTPPQTRGGRHQSRPSDGPLRLWRSSPPPRHRPHPGYGESAVWVSSQMRCTGK